MIAGGGPVGLVLGLVLAHHGVDVTICERNATTTRHPKMDVTNCRSMEIFRRLGIAERLRAKAVPPDHNMDVSWVTHMSGHEIHRFRYASVNEARARFRAVNDGAQPLEPNMRISQVLIEPELRDVLRTRPTVTLRYGTAVESFAQDADGVTTTIRSDGTTETVRSRYLVGCDGGGSVVRRALGIGLAGEASIRQRYLIHFRSTAREVLQRWGIAWHYQSPPFGILICQDDREIWTLHGVIPEGAGPEAVDPRELLSRFLGTEIECEILQANLFDAHLLLADRYLEGRVFLAGDSAHQYIPTGGYGMNTGVGDAYDLGWKLAARLAGWGGDGLLASYEPERRPVGQRNLEGARLHAETKGRIGALWDARLDADGPEGDRLRAEIGAKIAAIGNAENESLGIELGYRYDDLPVICAEPGAPALETLRYKPGTWPGMRAPSLYLADGRALFDLFGPGFTLVAFAGAETAGFARAAAERAMPLAILALDDAHARKVYERDLVLVRPDQHVAWRGAAPPADPGAILDRVRGGGVSA